MVKIEEIGEVIGGGTPPTNNQDNFGGNIPWITPKDLSKHNKIFIERGERNITENGLRNSAARLLPEGTILFTSRAPIGYIAIAKNEVTTNQGFKSIICNPDKVYNKFIYYVLRYNTEKIESIASGSTFKEVSGSTLKSFEILLPPLEEQFKIADILFKLDSKIELNRQMNQTLDAMGQALFKRWFVDFEFPNEKGEPYKSSGGEMVNSELGELPQEWEIKTFSEAIEVNPNRVLKSGTTARKVAMADIKAWQSWVDSWQVETYTSGPKFMNGDTLFARITPSLEHGKTALVDFLNDGEVAFGSTEFIVFAPKVIKSSVYIFHLARNDIVRQTAISAMTGSSGRQRVPNECFDYLLIMVPPTDIIAKFGEVATNMFKQIAVNATETRNLTLMRDSLLPKLMSGQIRVVS